MKKYGLDFGTTNSAIAIEENGVGRVLNIDLQAIDPRVIRTLLYFLRREMVFDKHVPPERIEKNEFFQKEISYEGEQKLLIGEEAVEKYLEDNKDRKPGKRLKIYTGNLVMATGAQSGDPVLEYYEEIDYGIGRFMQALKTALKSPMYKGTAIFGKFYTLEEMVSLFIKQVKYQADNITGENIDSVVVGRPVHFSLDAQKDQAAQERLEKALRLAGFKNITFEYEPVGAAKQFLASQRLPHSVRNDPSETHVLPNNDVTASEETKQSLVFVFDFGGGTLDTAIVKSGENPQVLAADGVYIGGDLLNADIMQHKLWNYFGANATWGEHQLTMPEYIYEAFDSWFSLPNLNNPIIMNALADVRYKHSNSDALDRLIYLIKSNLGFDIYEAIERAKIKLSSVHETNIVFESGPIKIDHKITREEFEKIIEPRVKEVQETVFRTLQKAEVEPSQIDVVVRTGGSSLIPVFENILAKIFGKEKIKQFETFTSIAAGLALE